MTASPGLGARFAEGSEAAGAAATGNTSAGGNVDCVAAWGGASAGLDASAGGGSVGGASIAKAVSAALRVMATMLIRRLMGLKGSSFTNKADEAKPTTRDIFSSG